MKDNTQRKKIKQLTEMTTCLYLTFVSFLTHTAIFLNSLYFSQTNVWFLLVTQSQVEILYKKFHSSIKIEDNNLMGFHIFYNLFPKLFPFWKHLVKTSLPQLVFKVIFDSLNNHFFEEDLIFLQKWHWNSFCCVWTDIRCE